MSTPWRLFVDTGGTFTDALAQSPEGDWLRAKVLSSGSLRGTVLDPIDGQRFKASLSWQTSADVLKGGEFLLLNRKHPPCRVTRFVSWARRRMGRRIAYPSGLRCEELGLCQVEGEASAAPQS